MEEIEVTEGPNRAERRRRLKMDKKLAKWSDIVARRIMHRLKLRARRKRLVRHRRAR